MPDENEEYGKRRLGTDKLQVKNGGVYTVILQDPQEELNSNEVNTPWVVHAIVPASSINIFWQRKLV